MKKCRECQAQIKEALLILQPNWFIAWSAKSHKLLWCGYSHTCLKHSFHVKFPRWKVECKKTCKNT
jgi:hypothetical protein